MAFENRGQVASAAQVVRLQPYWDSDQQTWVIDDARSGLSHEPFVNGYPDFLDRLLRDAPDAGRGFQIELSDRSFPGFVSHLIHQDDEYGGYWYASEDPSMKGWFGPVLERYFKKPPAELFVGIEPVKNGRLAGLNNRLGGNHCGTQNVGGYR
jgi:hypothetical protein